MFINHGSTLQLSKNGVQFERQLIFLRGGGGGGGWRGVCVGGGGGARICPCLRGLIAVHQVPLGFLMKLIWKFI